MWRIDRLRRSLLHVLNTVSRLRDHGIQVESISDRIDPATATGQLMLNMLATLAEYERELIVERVLAGVAVAQEAGTPFGRPTSDPTIVADKLAIVAAARAERKTVEKAASLVGGSRPTLYCHHNAYVARGVGTAESTVP